MSYKLVRQIRPTLCKLNHRSFGSKRYVPVVSPWHSRNSLSDFFRDQTTHMRNMERYFDDMWRDMEKVMDQGRFGGQLFRVGDALSKAPMLKCDSKGFELKLDVQEFSPSELKVKLSENKLTVSAKHEQKADEHGYISREFQREITIPENVNLDTMTSSISEEGILTIRADVKEAEKAAETVIDIQREQKETSS